MMLMKERKVAESELDKREDEIDGQARAKISELKNLKTTQENEISMLIGKLKSHNKQNGLQDLKDKLKRSQEQVTELETQLDSAFREWTKTLSSKEETIEFFRSEMAQKGKETPKHNEEGQKPAATRKGGGWLDWMKY